MTAEPDLTAVPAADDVEELEPGVARLQALANRLVGATDRSVPWSRRRQAGVAMARRFRRVVMPDGPEMAAEDDEYVPVDGGRVQVRVYRPRAGRLPVHVFLHGGGWCLGGLDERDPRCRQIAAGADCVVVSVDYRLAPENQWPTAPQDCFAVVNWVVAEAERLDVDPGRVSVGGESAGGNLAAVVALMARDRGGPALRYQWLDVPATDMTMQQPSIDATPEGFGLHRDDMTEFRDAYCPDPATWTDPYVSPLHATDLGGLPPAWVTTCGADPLRDDGRAYVARLRDAGVAVEHRHLPGHVHASFALTRLRSAAAHEAAAIAALRRALHP